MRHIGAVAGEDEAMQVEIDTRDREIIELALSFLSNNIKLAKEQFAWDSPNKSDKDMLYVQAHIVAGPSQREVNTLLSNIVHAGNE